MIVFPVENGMRVHHRILASGEPNRQPCANTPYPTITKDQIKEQLSNPPTYAKGEEWWVIYSEGNHQDTRLLVHQEAHAKFHALTVDIDSGNLPFDVVVSLCKAVLGDTEFWVYATRSCKPDDFRWRVVVWLQSPLPGGQHYVACMALYEEFSRIYNSWLSSWGQPQGWKVDKAPASANQVSYLPNRQAYWAYHVNEGPGFDFMELAPRVRELFKLREARKNQVANTKYDVGNGVIGTFNAKYDLEHMLERCGYIKIGKSWSSPYQQNSSGLASTDIIIGDDGLPYWLSLAANSDGNVSTLGRQTTNGNRTGDAFALFRHYIHNDDEEAAIAAARGELDYGVRESHPMPFMRSLEAMAAEGWRVWNNVHGISGVPEGPAARRKLLEQSAEKLKEFQVDSVQVADTSLQWDIDWPPGNIGAIAKWIYASSRRPVKQFAIAQAFFFAAGLAGSRYHFQEGGLNLYMMLGGESGVGKGESQRRREKLAGIVFETCQDPQSMIEVFGHDVAASGPGLRKMFRSPFESHASYKEDADGLLNTLMASAPGSYGEVLRSEMSKFWDKSGPGRVIGAVSYSKEENKVDAAVSAAYTCGIDTQVDPLKRFLGTTAIKVGFAQRWLYFMYYGGPFKPNRNVDTTIPEGLVERLALVWQHIRAMGPDVCQEVRAGTDIIRKLEEMEDKYIDLIVQDRNKYDIFNRANLNAGRLASLMAVFENHLEPSITNEQLDYAITLSERCCTDVSNILASGEAGGGEQVRIAKAIISIKEYAGMNPDTRVRYRAPKAVCDHGDIIPENYLIRKLSRLEDFKGSDQGKTSQDHVRATIAEMLRQGYIVKMTPGELASSRGIVVAANNRQELYVVNFDELV